MKHLHLTVTGSPRADANRRDVQPPRDQLGKLRWHRFEHDGERARRLDRLRVADQLLGGVEVAPLHAEAADLVDALRHQADVRHHRDSGVDHAVDRLRQRLAAFHLDRVDAALLHQPPGVGERLLDADVIAHKGHVADHQRLVRHPRDDAGVVDDVVERHRDRELVPLNHHAQRVADQQHRHARRLADARAHRVVSRQHHDRLVLSFHFLDVTDCDSHNRFLFSCSPAKPLSALCASSNPTVYHTSLSERIGRYGEHPLNFIRCHPTRPQQRKSQARQLAIHFCQRLDRPRPARRDAPRSSPRRPAPADRSARPARLAL